MVNNSTIEINLMFRPLLIIFGLIFCLLFFYFLIKYYYESVNYFVIFILFLILFIVLILFLIFILFKLSTLFNRDTEQSKYMLYFKNILSQIQTQLQNEYNSTSLVSIVILLIISVIIILYFTIPFIIQKINIQGGRQLIKEPISTNTLNVISSYEKLNGTSSFEYKYGISFWFFINSFSPSTNSNYNKFTSLLNYGNKPNILYNPSTNTLMITTEQKGLQETDKLLDFDDKGHRIIYKQHNILLQKWNNITINYTNGTLDVFLNNKLVKTAIEVVPYMTFDNLVVGTEGGISGGICNLIYFKKPLNAINISYLYNIVKDKTPPIINN